MRHIVILACLMLVSIGITLAGDQPTPDNKHIFIPIGIYYINGKYVNTVPFGKEPIDDLHECMERLQHIVGAIKTRGDVPEGGDIIGACMPVLAEMPS